MNFDLTSKEKSESDANEYRISS